MKILDIQKMPTTITEIPKGTTGVHESCMRAYHILRKAQELLALGTPSGVVLDLITEMETDTPTPPERVERSAQCSPLRSDLEKEHECAKLLARIDDMIETA